MKYIIRVTVAMEIMCLGTMASTAAETTDPAKLARPSEAQYQFQEQERIMFIHFHPGTWHGLEYDKVATSGSR